MPKPRNPWLNVIAAIVGGVALGYGFVRLSGGFWLVGGVWSVIGLILLWWALLDRRISTPGSPESEAGGGRTIE